MYQTEAIALYERMGFRRIPPFGDYREDPLSLFYETHVTGSARAEHGR
jgi:ribosomal protein S18 acetylase RimI-like enzyme